MKLMSWREALSWLFVSACGAFALGGFALAKYYRMAVHFAGMSVEEQERCELMARLLWPAAAVMLAIAVGMLAWMVRNDLRGRGSRDEADGREALCGEGQGEGADA